MREVDLILGPFADHALPALAPPALDAFEAFLAENDNDLLAWLTGSGSLPRQHTEIVGRIRAFHRLA
jgi:antitoxin CptB